MGRPTSITPQVAAIIDAQRAPGLSVSRLHERVAAAGVRIARGTLDRYLRGGAPGAAKQAAAALASDDLAELRAAQGEVAEARKGWAATLSCDPRAVRAYAALAKLQREVTQAIIELTPRSDADRYAPVEGAALAELLERAEASARNETSATAKLARYERLLADGLLVAADDAGGA